jgi:hypothetical protein
MYMCIACICVGVYVYDMCGDGYVSVNVLPCRFACICMFMYMYMNAIRSFLFTHTSYMHISLYTYIHTCTQVTLNALLVPFTFAFLVELDAFWVALLLTYIPNIFWGVDLYMRMRRFRTPQVHIHIPIPIHIHIHIHIHTYNIRTPTHYQYTYTYIYAYMYVYTYTYTYTYIFIYIYTTTYMYMYICRYRSLLIGEQLKPPFLPTNTG